jgi:aryl-alcohol dehydrogenase-like predicted oxidoreductase
MLIDHTAKDELFPLAKKMNVAVINGSPLGMGILADAPAPFLQNRQDVLIEAERRKEQISFLRKTEPRGLIEPAMRFSLTCPDISITLTGTTSLRSLRLNASYCDGKGLDEEEMTQIYQLFDRKPLFTF